MRMRNMPEVAAPELRQKSLLSYTEISEKTLEISNLVRFFWEWRIPRLEYIRCIACMMHLRWPRLHHSTMSFFRVSIVERFRVLQCTSVCNV